MYVFSREGLGQAPKVYDSIDGTLGEDFLPVKVREFVNKIGNRPEDYKKFLMVFELDPDFWSSPYFPKGYKAVDILQLIIDKNDVRANDQLRDELRAIVDDLIQRDKGFQQQVDTELKLQVAVTQAIRKLSEQKLKPFLQEILAKTLFMERELQPFSLNFAKKMLPGTLVQQITSSEFFKSHLNMISDILKTYAYALKKRQQQAAEQERIKRKRAEQERLKKKRIEQERQQLKKQGRVWIP